MTRTRLRAGRAGRALIALFVALVALAGPVVMNTVPAYAGGSGGGGSVDDGGPGNNNGGGGSTTPGGGQGYCRNGVLYNNGVKQFEGPYHNCVGYPAGGGGYNNVLCNTGFEVYRFYGTVANPTLAVVRGRLNRTSNCASADPSYRFATVDPFDSGDLSQSATIAPWHATREPNNPDMTRIAAKSVPGTMNDKLPVWRWQDTNTTDGLSAKLTDGVVSAQVKGNCKSAQTPNGFRTDLDNPAVDNETKQMIRALLWTAYQKLSNGGQNPTYALAQLGMTGFTKSGPAGNLPRDANGVYTDTFMITWSNLACSSPFDYVSSASAPGAANDTVTGVCYIPTMWSAKSLVVRSGKERIPWYDWSSVESNWLPGGLRYSAYYAGSQGTAGREEQPWGAALKGTSDAVAAQWRNAMAADYWSRVSGSPFADPSGLRTQKAPAQPYKNENSGRFSASPWNLSAAASALASDSRCHFGDHVSWVSVNNGGKTPPPSVSQTINVKVAPAFQVGGMLRVQQVTATAGPLLCGGKACSTTDRQHMLHYQLTVSGSNGYRLCAAGQTFGCDFAVVTKPTVLTGPNDVQQAQTIQLVFYNPTMPTQDVKVDVTGVAAAFEHDWSLTTPKGTLTGDDGQTFTLGGDVIHGTDVVAFTPTVVGAPKLVPVIGASNLPR